MRALANTEEQTILIVDDDLISRFSLKKHLEKMGHTSFMEVSSGEEAIELIKEQKKFGLIIMDIQLEGDINGIEAAHSINQFSDVPIFFLTASIDKNIEKKARATKFKGFITKPFSHDDLITLLKELQ